MGADGGYYFFKRSELESPEILRRIQNWFIVSNFDHEIDDNNKITWTMERYTHVSGCQWQTTTWPLDVWLKKFEFERVEDITLEFIMNSNHCYSSIIKKGSFPGLPEDLVRISYGDNCSHEIQRLTEVILRGDAWNENEQKPDYFENDVGYYDSDNDNDNDDDDVIKVWNWHEETWT